MKFCEDSVRVIRQPLRSGAAGIEGNHTATGHILVLAVPIGPSKGGVAETDRGGRVVPQQKDGNIARRAPSKCSAGPLCSRIVVEVYLWVANERDFPVPIMRR